MKALRFLSIAALFTIVLASSTQAQSKQLIYQRSRIGDTWRVYLLNKKLVKEVKLGGETRRLYLADMKVDFSSTGVTKRTSLFQCSTSAPFVAFKDSSVSGLAILHYINPGGNWFGYNVGSHWEYWAVCHDVWDAQRTNDSDLAAKARQLGYSTELKTEQIEIPHELMRSLK